MSLPDQTDPYSLIADYYDCEHAGFSEDIDFYLDTIEGGPVLELGAGTGRVMFALARAGLEVWGIESSPAMRDRAQRRLAGLHGAHLIDADARALPASLHARYVLLTLNFLWHLSTQDAQTALLVSAREALLPGGRVIIDVNNPLTMADRDANGLLRQRFRGLCSGGELTVASAAWDDPADQVLTVAFTYDWIKSAETRRATSTMTFRYVYRWELAALLKLAGLAPERVCGSYDGEPFGAQSSNILVVAAAK